MFKATHSMKFVAMVCSSAIPSLSLTTMDPSVSDRSIHSGFGGYPSTLVCLCQVIVVIRRRFVYDPPLEKQASDHQRVTSCIKAYPTATIKNKVCMQIRRIVNNATRCAELLSEVARSQDVSSILERHSSMPLQRALAWTQ